MHLQKTSKRHYLHVISAIRGSLLIAAGVLFWDLALEGFYMFSLLICPFWFLVSVVKNIIMRPGWGLAILRMLLPELTLGIAIINGNMQWNISNTHAEQIIKACDEFRVANGRYPHDLDELVPEYFTSIPPAKYCITGRFIYFNFDDHCILWWTRYGFYRRIYRFDDKEWHNLD
jgi:hypothetical protein